MLSAVFVAEWLNSASLYVHLEIASMQGRVSAPQCPRRIVKECALAIEDCVARTVGYAACANDGQYRRRRNSS